ncbi:MAG: hypothetical protein K8M05_39445 [Deltaproteobacteria bacterium]|nr:hypothetical protein [Kofleriaceae bacterium]
MTVERRLLLVLPPDWNSGASPRSRGEQGDRACELGLEETARALCRELQQRAILAAITCRK